MKAFALSGDAERSLALFRAINPIEATSTREKAERYQVEPFVMAADVYDSPQHVGRGGWTWYTGSAAWMYRVAVEDILGFKLHGSRLTISPCIPQDWDGFELAFRQGETRHHIKVIHDESLSGEFTWFTFDGESHQGADFELPQDGKTHEIVVHWRRQTSAPSGRANAAAAREVPAASMPNSNEAHDSERTRSSANSRPENILHDRHSMDGPTAFALDAKAEEHAKEESK